MAEITRVTTIKLTNVIKDITEEQATEIMKRKDSFADTFKESISDSYKSDLVEVEVQDFYNDEE